MIDDPTVMLSELLVARRRAHAVADAEQGQADSLRAIVDDPATLAVDEGVIGEQLADGRRLQALHRAYAIAPAARQPTPAPLRSAGSPLGR